MSEHTYIDIVGVKKSNLDPYQNFNNTLDTSGKVDEKINDQIKINTYNYIVNEITTDESQATYYVIFLKTTSSGVDTYTL